MGKLRTILDIDGEINRKFDRKKSCMQEHLYRHFSSPGDMVFLDDILVTLIDKMDRSDPKKREDYWMKPLKTMAPYSLNIDNSV